MSSFATYVCLELTRILLGIENLLVWICRKKPSVLCVSFLLVSLLFLYFYLFYNRLKILLPTRLNSKELKHLKRNLKSRKQAVLMDKLCCLKKICHQNLSLISHSRTINKEAVLQIVALCFVVPEIRDELIFISNPQGFLFSFIFYIIQSLLFIFKSFKFYVCSLKLILFFNFL